MRIHIYFGVSISIIIVSVILGFVVQDIHAGRGGGGSVGGGGGRGGGSPRFIAPPLIPSLLFGNRKSRCRPETIVVAGAVGDECRKKALGPLRAHGNGVHCEPMRRYKNAIPNPPKYHKFTRNPSDTEDEDEKNSTNTNNININSNSKNNKTTSTSTTTDFNLNATMTEVVIECVCVWSTDCFFEKVDNGARSMRSNMMGSLDFLLLYPSVFMLLFVPLLL